MQKKEIIIFGIIILMVLTLIFTINYVKGNSNNNPPTNSTANNNSNNQEVIQCIGEKSKLLVSPTCGYCAKQKQDLAAYYENYTDYIKLIDISENPEILNKYKIQGVPSWIIDEEIYSGLKSIDYLREKSGC